MENLCFPSWRMELRVGAKAHADVPSLLLPLVLVQEPIRQHLEELLFLLRIAFALLLLFLQLAGTVDQAVYALTLLLLLLRSE